MPLKFFNPQINLHRMEYSGSRELSFLLHLCAMIRFLTFSIAKIHISIYILKNYDTIRLWIIN